MKTNEQPQTSRIITGINVILREKRLDDAATDYKWETDSELAKLDATKPITMSFTRYRSDYAEELREVYTASCRFAVETRNGKHIGNCAYYNINERRGDTELGIMIGDRDFWNKGYGTDIVSTLLNYIFRNTNLKRVYLKTLSTNYRAQHCFRKAGFKPFVQMIKDGHDFLFMEILRSRWEDLQKKQPDSSSTAMHEQTGAI